MWKEIESFKNVRYFGVNDKYLIYLNDKGLIQAFTINDLNKKVWEFDAKNIYLEFSVSNNILLTKTVAIEMDINCFSPSSGSKIILPIKTTIKDLRLVGELVDEESTQSLFYCRALDESRFCVRIDFLKNSEPQLIWKRNFDPNRYVHLGDKKMIISINKGNRVAKIDFTTGDIIWDFPLQKYSPQFQNDFINDLHFNNEIVVGCTNEGAMFGLNIENGNTIWHLPKVPFPNELQRPLSVRNLEFFPKENIIVGLRQGVYWEIETDTGEISTLIKMREHFTDSVIGGGTAISFSVENNGNLILFQTHPNNFITFNRKTLEVVSITPFEINGDSFQGPWQGPIVKGDLCFLKDNLGTLHIFQK